MSLIDLGKDYDTTAKEVGQKGTFAPLPANRPYQFEVASVEEKQYPQGRKYLNVRLNVVNDSDYTGRVVWYKCPLPYAGMPETDKGIGFLFSLAAGCGVKWEGTQIDPDQMIGCVIDSTVKHSPRKRNGEVVIDEITGGPVIDTEIKAIKSRL